ncbi:type I-E CRISPR-associated protein Cse1/CasA [Streptomyces sp. N2A]|uniref:type I-E CRISPR-associated protein Cse1/CasA n=1 Tax=Streptomyces sp. N2A TaxID=3073936 RepID=UPI0028708611|nr:type I-E CRISPR-associated protein Cse1/CasA [Streptomyces sp. N2A]
MPDESPPPDVLSFDLTCRRWLPVQYLDGTPGLLSLREVFEQAGRVRRLVGDVPTQEFALLRLLLAMAHDALQGPADIDEWADLWADNDCFGPLSGYLEECRGKLDLLHATAPFFQVAGLRTGRDEVFDLNRIVADVPNGEPFLSARMPAVDRISFAEAARWLIHAHAYDTSGIKTGVAGDDRVKGGKVYPLGVGWAGNLGGVFAEGITLRETLLLNLIAADSTDVHVGNDDRPAWRRDACGPGATAQPALAHRPSGVRDLYTWQTRRLRLHFDADGVHGVVLGYGDPLMPHNRHQSEPMTGWRRSQAQEKKRGEALVYMPREHDPARQAWRGLAALIADRVPGTAQGSEPAASLRPGVLKWVARLATEGVLPRRYLIRARVVGALYGTQQSVIDDIVDDQVAMAVVLLHQGHADHASVAISAVTDAEACVSALGDLAGDLARAAGRSPEPVRDAARETGFGALDGPYRAWLAALGEAEDPHEQRTVWQRDVYRIVSRLGQELLTGAGDAAWEGRMVESKKGSVWLNSSLADRWFRGRLNTAVGAAFSSDAEAAGTPGDSFASDSSSPKVPA